MSRRQFKRTQQKSQQKGGALPRLVLLFIVFFFALSWAYQESRGTFVETLVIDKATVLPSAYLINIVNPDAQAWVQGHRIVSDRVRLSVLNGCEGTESLFLLIAAILAFKTSWRHKLYGALAGCVIIYAINQVRIVALYFALQHDRMLFSVIHGIIGPTVIILLGCLFYLWWLQWPLRGPLPGKH